MEEHLIILVKTVILLALLVGHLPYLLIVLLVLLEGIFYLHNVFSVILVVWNVMEMNIIVLVVNLDISII